MGTVTLTIQGEIIGTTDPIAGKRCLPQSAFVYAVPRAGSFFQHGCKVVVMLTMLVIGAYLIFTVGRILRIWSKEM